MTPFARARLFPRDGRITGYTGVEDILRRFGQYIFKSHLPPPGTPTQPIEAGYMANAWIQMRHPDYDAMREIFEAILYSEPRLGADPAAPAAAAPAAAAPETELLREPAEIKYRRELEALSVHPHVPDRVEVGHTPVRHLDRVDLWHRPGPRLLGIFRLGTIRC